MREHNRREVVESVAACTYRVEIVVGVDCGWVEVDVLLAMGDERVVALAGGDG